MRALSCLGSIFASMAVLLGFAGCGGSVSDPCKGVAGSCVALTVKSSTVTAVDSLHILATGALTGDQRSSGARASLPIVVALKLPSGVSGTLDLHVDGVLMGAIVGSGDTSAVVTAGQHTTAVCTLSGPGGGVVDLSAGGGDDLTGTTGGGPDLAAPPCDPIGVTGPQCVWRWQTPLPQGDGVLSIVAFDDANTFMLNSDGYIFYRDATRWSMLAARPMTTGFYTLNTLFGGGAGMDLYAGGTASTSGAPLAFHSTDKGVTWTQEALPGAATGQVGRGATSGKAAILPSSASGNVYQRDATSGSWTTRSANASASVNFNAAAMNANGAVVVGTLSGTTAAISYSTNDGAAWTAVAAMSITPSAAALYDVCVGTSGTVNSYWAVGAAGANGIILHGAGNSPATWSQQGAAATTGKTLWGCVATDATHAWAFGIDGLVLATTDGSTWTAVGAPGAATDWLHVGAHSSGTALFIGGTNTYDGTLYRSVNAGAAFSNELAGTPAAKLDAIYGVAPATVFAVGESGTIVKTSDDGATWAKLPNPGSGAQLTGVWAASPTDVYAVGNGGTIVHSSDGTTFTEYSGANAPTSTTLFQDVWGSPTFGVYAVGYAGLSAPTRVVYRTTDHGASWAPVVISGFTGATGEVLTAFALGGDVWVAGDSGNVYHSSDGATFTPQNTGITGLGITRMRGVTGHIIALIGNDPGYYISTVNNGVSWTQPTTQPLNDSPENVAFAPDESAIYVFGPFSGPIVSYDKAATWNFVPTAMYPNAVRNAFAFAGNDVFIVGDTGIIHYGN